MTTKTSSFSTARMMGFYRSALGRAKGFGIFYFILSFGFLPMQYIMNLERIRGVEQISYNLFGMGETYSPFSLVLFPMIQMVTVFALAIYLFSFIHNKQAVDMYHAMPVTRTEIYLANTLTAMSFIIPTLMINFGIIAATAGVKFGSVYGIMALEEMLYWILVSFAVFSITAFATVSVGTVLDSVIFSGALLGGFSLIYGTIYLMLNGFVLGFYTDSISPLWILRLSPVGAIAERLARSPGSPNASIVNTTIWVWFLIGLVILFVGNMAYKKRPSEMAQTLGNMGPIQLLVRSEGVFLGGIALGTFFCAVFNKQSISSYVFSIFICSIVVYAVMELILSRNVSRIIKNAGIALISSVGVALFTFFMVNGCFGYEMRVPNIENIEKVELNYSPEYRQSYTDADEEERVFSRGSVFLSDPTDIADVVNFHSQITTLYGENKNQISPYMVWDEIPTIYRSVEISYLMKDGSRMSRRYTAIPVSLSDTLLSFEANDQILEETGAVYTVPVNQIQNIILTPASGQKGQEGLTVKPGDYERILQAIRQDMKDETAETLKNPAIIKGNLSVDYTHPDDVVAIPRTSTSEGTIEVTDKALSSVTRASYRNFTTPIFSHYTNTIRLLQQLELDSILTNDFTVVDGYIVVRYQNYSVLNIVDDEAQYFYSEMEEYPEDTKYIGYHLEDAADFYNQHKSQFSSRQAGNDPYVSVYFQLEDGSYLSLILPATEMPEEAHEFFQNNEYSTYDYQRLITMME